MDQQFGMVKDGKAVVLTQAGHGLSVFVSIGHVMLFDNIHSREDAIALRDWLNEQFPKEGA